MEIALVIFPHTKSTHIGLLKKIPRIGEKVFVEKNLYEVKDIYHNIDENLIKVCLMKSVR